MHAPLHLPQPGWHSRHIPWLQYGVSPPQTLPQAPQFLGSQSTGMQAPLQNSAPLTHL